MSESHLKHKISEDLKTSMRAQDKPKVATLRLIMAAFKQIEVDQRIELDDQHVLSIQNCSFWFGSPSCSVLYFSPKLSRKAVPARILTILNLP